MKDSECPFSAINALIRYAVSSLLISRLLDTHMQILVLIIYPHKHTFFDNKHNYTQLSRCLLSTTRLSLYNKNRYRTDAIIPVYYFFTPSLLSSYLVSDFSFSSLSSGLFSLESSKKSTLLSRLYRIVFLYHLLPVSLFCTF